MRTKETTSAVTRSTGSAISVGGEFGATYSGTHDTSQTRTTVQRSDFAGRAAPPENPMERPLRVIGGLIALLVAIILLNKVVPGLFRFVLGGGRYSGPGVRGLEHLIWAIIALAAVWAFFSFMKLPVYRAELGRWKKSWICLACGDRFVPDA